MFDFSSLPPFSLSRSGRAAVVSHPFARGRERACEGQREREKRAGRSERAGRGERRKRENSNSSGSRRAGASKDSERAKRASQRERGEQAKQAGKRKKESAWPKGPLLVGHMRLKETRKIRTQFRHIEPYRQRGRMTELSPKVETDKDRQEPEPIGFKQDQCSSEAG